MYEKGRMSDTGYSATLPTTPGLYDHQWVFHGQLKSQQLFVGYINGAEPRWQGTKPGDWTPRILKCCPPDEYLHNDRLTPEDWGGLWLAAQEPAP